MTDQNWRKEAACLGYPTSLFFPHDQDPDEPGPRRRETPRLYRQALRLCGTCPVQQECLNYALELPELFGMFGGKTRPERATILRERRQIAREDHA